jgi:hypothetical protein
VTASSLRRSPFGLRRSARDPWRLPGTRRVRSRAGRASRSLPRVSPDATLARAHPHAAAFGGSAASAATRSNDNYTDNENADDNYPSANDNIQIRLGWRHVPPRRASAPGYRRGDLADSPRYQTPHMVTSSQRRRSFAAIQRRAPRQLTAPQASSRPDYRAWCCRRGAVRLLVSVAVRSPSGFPQRHHGGRPATRHPHCASLLRCRCGRPAAVFRSPVWQPRRLPRGTATGSHLRRVRAHAIPAPEPACHTALSGVTTRRTCGRPCGRCQSLALGGSRPHPDRYGRRRSFAASASVSASAPDAASHAPCVPAAHAAAFHLPSVAAAAASRRAPATRRWLPHTFSLWQPNAGTKPGGLVPLPDPLPQQFNQQSNEQLQNILGWRHVPPRRASAPGYRRGDLADSPRYQQPHIATGSTLPPRACARHACIAPSGERLTSTQSACLQDRLRYLQASPSLLFGTVAGGRYAAASRRKACHTPSSLRRLAAVSMRQARRRFHLPSVAAPTAATRTATGSHSRRCFAAIRDGPGLPHGRFGKIRPSARVAAVAVPYGHRSSFAAAASVSAGVPARFLAGSLRAGALAAVFMSPVWQPPPESDRLPHRRARAAAAVPPGRGLCAWIHAPARTPAVIAGCRHAAPAQHQCRLPRQLSAAGLARAFAPRRATSGLVRIPPASVSFGGEGRSLGEG